MNDELRSERKRIIQNHFNSILREKWLPADHSKGKEIDLSREWCDAIAEDGSILWDYEKIGWRVMQYRRGRNNKADRTWVCFTNPSYKERR